MKEMNNAYSRTEAQYNEVIKFIENNFWQLTGVISYKLDKSAKLCFSKFCQVM